MRVRDALIFMLLGYLLCIVTIALIATANKAEAQDWVGVTVGSYHFDRERKHNEIQLPSLHYEHGFSRDWRGIVGTYKNSFWRQSSYVGAVYSPLHFDVGPEVSLGVLGGLFTGYTEGRADPIVALAGSVEWDRYGVNATWIPPILGTKGVVALQLKWRFR